MPRSSLTLLLLFLLPLASAAADLATEMQSLYEQGEYAKVLELAESSKDGSADVSVYQGLALAQLGRLEEAQTIFRRARDRHPRDKRFPLELAGVAYRGKRNSEAKRLLRKALRLDPNDEYGNDFLGSLYLLEGNVAAALKYWNRIDKPLIQDVAVTPPPPLRPVLRERSIAISGGQIFTHARLRETEANLDRLDIFSRRQFELSPRQDQRFDLTVRLLPIAAPFTGWAGRLLPMARGLPYQAIPFDVHNIDNRAINFQSLWRWDSNKRRVDLELGGPLRLSPRAGFRIGVDARDENWDLTDTYQPAEGEVNHLKLKKAVFDGGFVFALTRKLEWATGLKITRRSFDGDDGSAIFADSWSFEQRNQLAYRLLDLPERRLRVDSNGRLRTGRVVTGAKSRFGIVEGELSGSWQPDAQGDVWQAHARMRAGMTFGRIPFDEYFQLGMERDNDLWMRGHAGTRDGVKGNAPLGTDYAIFQTDFDRTVAEFRFLRFRAGPFFDTGTIAGPNGTFGSKGWLFDTGVQVKIIVAGGLTWSVVYGRDLRGGHGVFYTSVRY